MKDVWMNGWMNLQVDGIMGLEGWVVGWEADQMNDEAKQYNIILNCSQIYRYADSQVPCVTQGS